MDLEGEFKIGAPRAEVWAMLMDADVLRACIPGCQSLEGNAADGFSATVKVAIGPVKATFSGSVEITDAVPPQSCRIVGAGKGGVAGFAKGSSDVTLSEEDGATVLRYVADAQIGGKLAQLGSRLVKSSANKLSTEFFATFSALASGAPADPDGAAS